MNPPKRMNFWKSSKQPLTPPPHFRKVMLQFFLKFMTEVSSIMANICNINFWIENDPPPSLELFRKFIRFGRGKLPLPRNDINVRSSKAHIFFSSGFSKIEMIPQNRRMVEKKEFYENMEIFKIKFALYI